MTAAHPAAVGDSTLPTLCPEDQKAPWGILQRHLRCCHLTGRLLWKRPGPVGVLLLPLTLCCPSHLPSLSKFGFIVHTGEQKVWGQVLSILGGYKGPLATTQLCTVFQNLDLILYM